MRLRTTNLLRIAAITALALALMPGIGALAQTTTSYSVVAPSSSNVGYALSAFTEDSVSNQVTFNMDDYGTYGWMQMFGQTPLNGMTLNLSSWNETLASSKPLPGCAYTTQTLAAVYIGINPADNHTVTATTNLSVCVKPPVRGASVHTVYSGTVTLVSQ